MATIVDLKLDLETLDLAVEDGDIVIIEDADVVAQQICVRLQRQLGEWYLDITSGVDYLNDIAPKGAPREAVLRDAIASVPFVAGITAFDLNLDNATRILILDFTVKTAFGDVSASIEVP